MYGTSSCRKCSGEDKTGEWRRSVSKEGGGVVNVKEEMIGKGLAEKGSKQSPWGGASYAAETAVPRPWGVSGVGRVCMVDGPAGRREELGTYSGVIRRSSEVCESWHVGSRLWG